MRFVKRFFAIMRGWSKQRIILYSAILLIAVSLGATALIVLTVPGGRSGADVAAEPPEQAQEPSPPNDASAQKKPEENGSWKTWIKGITVVLADEADPAGPETRLLPETFDNPVDLEEKSGSAAIRLELDPAHAGDVLTHMNEIDFEGSAASSIDDRAATDPDHPVLSIRFASIRGTLVVRIGDFPAIRLLDIRDEVAVAVETKDPSVPVQRLADRLLRVPADQRELIVAFSRPVSGETDIRLNDQKAKGTWVDDRHFAMSLPSRATRLYFSVKAVGTDGKPEASDAPVTVIERVPDRQWYRYPAGTKVGFSRWDRYYDFLLFSPDGKQYVGMTDGWFAEGEGDNGYSLTLERKGKQPTLLKEYDQIFGFPLQWLDNTRLLFWGEDGAFVYDTAANARTAIMPLQDGRKIRSATYDAAHDLFTAIVDRANGGGGGYGHEKWLVQHVSAASSRNYGYEELADDKADEALEDFAVTQGVFHSTVAWDGDSRSETVAYEGLNGNSWSRSGRGILVHDDKLAVETGDAGQPLVFLSPNRGETPIAPLRGYNMHPFGDRLIGAYWTFMDQPSESMEYADYLYAAATIKAYRIYDYGTNAWKPLFAGKTPWIRYQPFDPLYRLDVGH